MSFDSIDEFRLPADNSAVIPNFNAILLTIADNCLQLMANPRYYPHFDAILLTNANPPWRSFVVINLSSQPASPLYPPPTPLRPPSLLHQEHEICSYSQSYLQPLRRVLHLIYLSDDIISHSFSLANLVTIPHCRQMFWLVC